MRFCGIDLLGTLLSSAMSTKDNLCRRLDALVLDFFSKVSYATFDDIGDWWTDERSNS